MHGYLRGHYLPTQMSAVRPVPSSRPGQSFERKSNGPTLRATPVVVHELPRDVSSRFGLRLREFRRSRNMTQLRMAVDFGIDRSFISDVERGRKSASLQTLEILALGLNVSLSDLLDGI